MADPIHAFEADGTPSPGAQTALNGKANTSHTHAQADVTGLPAKLTELTNASARGAWTAITPASGYEARGGFACRIESGRVYIRGGVTATFAPNADVVIGTMPTGFRPPTEWYYGTSTGANATQSGLAIIKPDGEFRVRASANGASYQQFNDCSFPLD